MSSRSSSDQDEQTRYHATSNAIEQWITQINRRAPVNLEFITDPLCKASAYRIRSLEDFYARSRIFRFLIRKGVNPTLLFLGTSTGLALALKRLYSRSTYLTLNIVGVLYPAWRCWHLVKAYDQEDQAEENTIETLRECKSWLTYWILYGCIQGEHLRQQQQQQQLYTSISPNLQDDEDLTLIVERTLNETESSAPSFRLLDGYTPPTLANDHDSNSSGSESPLENQDMEDHHHVGQVNKQKYPILVPMEEEVGW
ncbi:hypothetical protein EC973_007459 [Apophysomyces ossiformis]|uniref:Uncharacterized protein n=1 Tax=Apophysomyces ossiformis TaxID=679940 RepID=A0A8H7EPS2_9FUNG|nr:hypothetical protein EC973_007459 [Apophysomyces ossiformis]